MGLDFNIALGGIKAGETMISTAQNNIANASNTSYARQRVELNTVGQAAGNSGVNAQLGSGVDIEGITRLKDDLLIQQSRNELGTTGYYSAKKDVLTNIETVFNETAENSISDLMLNFFNSFEEASKFPEQSSYRLNAVYTGNMLAEKIRNVSSQLDEVKEQTDQKVTTEVKQVNNILEKIANINKKMENVYSDKANALMDERDKYLDELSSYVDVSVTNKSNPMNMEIKVGNATLLAGKSYYEVKPLFVTEQDKWVLAASDVEFKPKSGSISGLLETRNNYINTYTEKLNDLVSNFITEVNDLHTSGYALDGTAGQNFFLGSDIRTIQVDPQYEKNPEKVALSSESGVIGNGDIAKSINDLKDKAFMDGTTPVNYYQAYTVRLATDLNIAKENEQIHSDVQQALESQRQEVQGVNIDEEMTDLLQFQKYYQANAKTLTTVNKVLDELLAVI